MQKVDILIRQIGKQWITTQTFLGFIFLYLPIFILIIYSFNASKTNTNWQGFTLDWYLNLLPNSTNQMASERLWTALNNSLIIGAFSTVISTILGTMLALALERFRFPGKKIVETLLFLPMIVPEISLGISLLVFFSLIFQLIENLTSIHLVLGLPTVIIGHVAFTISFVTITVRARLAEIDISLEEAALDLGANEWQSLSRVTLPLIWPGILSAALLALTLSLDDFVVTFFTTGVGATTLPLFVYGMIKFSVTPAINAISTLMLLVSILLVILSLFVDRKKIEK